jgi:hypothetical protein
LYLSDSNHNSTIRCQDKTILGNYDTIFSSTESTITIQLHLDGDPQFTWVAVPGMSVAHLYYFISLFLYLLSICLLLSYFAIYYHYCYLSYISSRLWISQTGISFDNRLCNNTPEMLLWMRPLISVTDRYFFAVLFMTEIKNLNNVVIWKLCNHKLVHKQNCFHDFFSFYKSYQHYCTS